MKTIDSNGARGAYAAVSDEAVEAMSRETEFARGLPNEAFTSQAFLDLENQYVFSRSWVCCRSRQRPARQWRCQTGGGGGPVVVHGPGPGR